LQKAVGAVPTNRNLSQFLTTFGLDLLSRPPQGGFFSTVAAAAKQPTEQLFSDLDAQRNLQRQLALTAAQSDIEFEREKELLEDELASKEKIAAMKQKDMFAAQTPEEQFRERLKVYGESSIPVIKNNATDLANFEVKNRDQNYVQLDFVYDRETKQFQPDFRSIPEGALTYNPQDGLAYRNVGGQFQKLNPFTLEPLENIDGSES
jgi:flagellar biosynthesis GTPase FlhF